MGQALEREYSLADLLRRPGVDYDTLVNMHGGAFVATSLLDPIGAAQTNIGMEGEVPVTAHAGCEQVLRAAVVEQVEISLKYQGYIDRQKEQVERSSLYEHMALPLDFDYLGIPALGFEVRQTLNKQRPQTLGQASRISGVTPVAISLLLVHLKKLGLRPHDKVAPL
jgi:tRNA uridine 5-carboxymethylaminomethyl modification enzyme